MVSLCDGEGLDQPHGVVAHLLPAPTHLHEEVLALRHLCQVSSVSKKLLLSLNDCIETQLSV